MYLKSRINFVHLKFQISEPTNQCHFLERENEGQTRLFNLKRSGIQNFDECQVTTFVSAWYSLELKQKLSATLHLSKWFCLSLHDIWPPATNVLFKSHDHEHVKILNRSNSDSDEFRTKICWCGRLRWKYIFRLFFYNFPRDSLVKLNCADDHMEVRGRCRRLFNGHLAAQSGERSTDFRIPFSAHILFLDLKPPANVVPTLWISMNSISRCHMTVAVVKGRCASVKLLFCYIFRKYQF